MSDPEVRAAGGVVVRDGADGPEVAVVHRPRYDDWSLPKGKLKPGEGWEQAALREVEEETGLRCELCEELDDDHYRDRKRREKRVRWWRMRPLGASSNPATRSTRCAGSGRRKPSGCWTTITTGGSSGRCPGPADRRVPQTSTCPGVFCAKHGYLPMAVTEAQTRNPSCPFNCTP